MELGGGGGAAGEDRLSALPDDVLVVILLKLTTRAAAQTRVLSRRWRHIWALLPRLSFPSPLEPHRFRDVLDDHNVLLRHLLVGADGATPESLAVWLPAAARRVSGYLALVTLDPVEDAEEEEEVAQRGTFEFPCFDKATNISFILSYQGLTVPIIGVFAHLTELLLSRVWFHGPGEVGDVVSSPRCPCLQRLTIEDAGGLWDLAIHSESMLSMKLSNLRTLSRLTVVAPTLWELTVVDCFVSPPVADISAPLLFKFLWDDTYDPSSVHLGKMTHLKRLGTTHYLVYGLGAFPQNQSCLSLLQCFEAIKALSLTLAYPRDIENYDYMMDDMAVLPDITFLGLTVIENGHAFGASAFHVLRLCTGIRSLILQLIAPESKAQTVCTSGCKCVQVVEWETEELLLSHLEEVEILGWSGTEHELAFVKRLFDWGTKLEKMTVKFFSSISEVKSKELYKTLHSFSRPGVCMKVYRNENSLEVLYAPKD